MADTLVSARIPKAKKESVSALLASMDATVSDLIQRSFDYVLATKEMPSVQRSAEKPVDEFEAFCADCVLDIDWSVAGADSSYDSIIRAGKVADYESLA